MVEEEPESLFAGMDMETTQMLPKSDYPALGPDDFPPIEGNNLPFFSSFGMPSFLLFCLLKIISINERLVQALSPPQILPGILFFYFTDVFLLSPLKAHS